MGEEFEEVQVLRSEEKSMAMLIHLLAIFTGFLGPLILWLVKKDESEFINHHGKQNMNLHIWVTIGYFVSFILAFVLIGFLTMFLVGMYHIIFLIVAAVKANDGEYYEFPLMPKILK